MPDLPLAESCIMGAPGRGLELTLKTLQISRTMCAALSLGAGDTALRVALDFALERRIFGDTVANIPSARAQLTGAYVDLLICECLSLAAARAVEICPERLSVWSSVVKFLAPSMVEDLIREAAIVLGARHYLREGWHSGIFQKMMRDNAVVGLFDGSTAVNLHIISGQLVALMAKRGSSPEQQRRLPQLFDFSVDLPWRGFPSAARLTFTNDGYDEIVDGLRSLAVAELPPRIASLIDQLRTELQSLEAEVAAIGDPKDRRANSVRRFALARRYCLISAGAACVLTWAHNRATGEDWVIAALQRILTKLHGGIPADLPDALFERMVEQHRKNHSFSLRPLSESTEAARR